MFNLDSQQGPHLRHRGRWMLPTSSFVADDGETRVMAVVSREWRMGQKVEDTGSFWYPSGDLRLYAMEITISKR